MFVFVLISFFVGMGIRAESDSSDESDIHFRSYKRTKEQELNLAESFFNWLENYQVGADPATEAKYPWIARVVHSRNGTVPHMCTASCVDTAIFITAARCIYSLKVNLTTIIYKSRQLHALAFVLPSEMSKQAFDDIGFIVVKTNHVKGEWSTVKLFNDVKRTDNTFAWFTEFANGNIKSRVVGYAAAKGPHRIWNPNTQYNLTSLDVVISLDTCPTVLTDQEILKAFVVPCYHACNIPQLLSTNELCKKYHGVEGGALIDTLTKKLIGVATWGSYNSKISVELPVGFAFANSVNFYKDFICAKLIRDSKAEASSGFFQSLCD